MESTTIAGIFILSYRVVKKEIQNKGRNTFLLDKLSHSSVGSDFDNTDEAIRNKYTK